MITQYLNFYKFGKKLMSWISAHDHELLGFSPVWHEFFELTQDGQRKCKQKDCSWIMGKSNRIEFARNHITNKHAELTEQFDTISDNYKRGKAEKDQKYSIVETPEGERIMCNDCKRTFAKLNTFKQSHLPCDSLVTWIEYDREKVIIIIVPKYKCHALKEP